MPSGSDDPARCLAGDPAVLALGDRPGRGMGDPLDGVVGMGDHGPLNTDAKVDPAASIGLAWAPGRLGDDRSH
jgi:hypothetical protein